MNAAEDIQIISYRQIKWKYAISWLAIILTGGFALLLFYWKPTWWLSLTHKLCNPNVADYVLIKLHHQEKLVRKVETKSERDRIKYLKKHDKLIGGDGNDFKLEYQLLESDGNFTRVQLFRYFHVRKKVYFYSEQQQSFVGLEGLDQSMPCSKLYNLGCSTLGLNEITFLERFFTYQENRIFIKLKPIWQLLLLEALNPFYVFQIFSVTIWYIDFYYYFSTCILIMSAISLIATIYQIRTNQNELRSKIHSLGEIQVLRNGQQQKISSAMVVPGDIIIIPKQGCKMECDAVLIKGICVVNESMLTGESVPVTKTCLPDENVPYCQKFHAKHTLFSGTLVLQARHLSHELRTTALVIRTGYLTSKGQLVRSILYPKPIDTHFIRDLLKMLLVLASIATVGFVYTIVKMSFAGYGIKKILIRAMDVVTIVVPPALPAAMTIGIIEAKQRLSKQSIYCISPSTINTCGEIDTVVFDKTGTLTEEGLSFQCVLPVNGDNFANECFNPKDLQITNQLALKALLTCHSLAIIDGKLIGDPLDITLFEWTGFELRESTNQEQMDHVTLVVSDRKRTFPLGIIKQFAFHPTLQRMSVIVKDYKTNSYWLFAKGSPVKLISLCKAESVPSNFQQQMNHYTSKGLRTLGIACKQIDQNEILKVTRNQAEIELNFIGLLSLENRLKPETISIINQLNVAKLKLYMATGDNILTALSIADECSILKRHQPTFTVNAIERENGGIEVNCDPWMPFSISGVNSDQIVSRIDTTWPLTLFEDNINKLKHCQLAMSGDTFDMLHNRKPTLLQQLIPITTVYARMQPEHKTELINQLQQSGFIVSMCGDGANDCGALKAAHAGICLSEAEASIASPFTCTTGSIECVPTLIREGRCALVTSFGVFKFMAGYSLTQFLSVSLFYWVGTTLADFQFLYIDLFQTTLFAVFFGYTEACDYLSPKPPPNRILSMTNVISIVLQMFLIGAFQAFVFVHVTYQPWFVPFTDPINNRYFKGYQITVVFLLSTFQYIGLVIIFSRGFPYRKSIVTNKPLSAALVISATISVLLTTYPPNFAANVLDLKMPPFYQYRQLLILISILYVFCSVILERFVTHFSDLVQIQPFRFKKQKLFKSKIISIQYHANRTRTCEEENFVSEELV